MLPDDKCNCIRGRLSWHVSYSKCPLYFVNILMIFYTCELYMILCMVWLYKIKISSNWIIAVRKGDLNLPFRVSILSLKFDIGGSSWKNKFPKLRKKMTAVWEIVVNQNDTENNQHNLAQNRILKICGSCTYIIHKLSVFLWECVFKYCLLFFKHFQIYTLKSC
jgi:hypothetical protein